MKWALIALCAILLTPLALVDVPPLLDYPNHLARAAVLAFGANDPILSRMYATRWAIIPNLGIDLVLPPLLHVMPLHLAGRIVIAVAILLPVLGTIAYSRAVFREWSWWPLGAALVAYNEALLLGFLNFTAAMGLALLFAAAWIAWRDAHPRRTVALASVGTVALFFCHLMGLAFFYVLISGSEAEWLWRHRINRAAFVWRIAALLPLIAAPLILYAQSPIQSMAADPAWPSLSDKAMQLLAPFVNYVLPLDIATACLVAGFLLICLATGRCRVPTHAALTLALVGLLFAASPSAFKGTFSLDMRVAIVFGFLMFGALMPTRLPRLIALATTAIVIMLFAIRMVVLSLAWHEHQGDLHDLRAVIDRVEPGARVFVAFAPSPTGSAAPLSRRLSTGVAMDAHLPALLLIERHAYWPFLFDNPSQQPVATLEPYRDLAERIGAMPDYHALDTPGQIDLCGYDYVLLLEAGNAANLSHFASDRLQLLATSDIAALFRIKPTPCTSN